MRDATRSGPDDTDDTDAAATAIFIAALRRLETGRSATMGEAAASVIEDWKAVNADPDPELTAALAEPGRTPGVPLPIDFAGPPKRREEGRDR